MYIAGAHLLPAPEQRAAVDVVLRALRGRAQRPTRLVALQLAGGQQQLPRAAHRLLPLHQVPLQQTARGRFGLRGPLFPGAQALQPGYVHVLCNIGYVGAINTPLDTFACRRATDRTLQYNLGHHATMQRDDKNGATSFAIVVVEPVASVLEFDV